MNFLALLGARAVLAGTQPQAKPTLSGFGLGTTGRALDRSFAGWHGGRSIAAH